MPHIDLTFAEMKALNTLCELELGQKPEDRIAAWRDADTAQDKLLTVLPVPREPRLVD